METNKNTWATLCHENDLVANAGVCALLNNEHQIALFSVPSVDEKVFAIGNYDPLGKANVLYRGIVGSHKGEPVVASPLYKQQYSLRTGQCIQEEAQVVAYATRIHNDMVQIRVE